MRRATQLCIACALLLVYQCAAQNGGGATKAKSTYAHSRTFGEWEHALHEDPLILVAFIAAVLSGALEAMQAFGCLHSHWQHTFSQQVLTHCCVLQCLGFCLSCGLSCMITSTQQQ